MPSARALARRFKAPRSRWYTRQCYGKQALPSRRVAAGVATRGHGLHPYRCANCGAWHVGHSTATGWVPPIPPRLRAGPGPAGWTAARLLQAVAVFVHHYGREPDRIVPDAAGRLAFW